MSYSRIHDRGADRIKIDLNYLWRSTFGPIDQRHLHLPGDRTGPLVSCLGFDELAAGKLTALLDRATARDLWDTAQLAVLSHGSWPGPRSQAFFVAYAGTLPKALTSYTLERLARRAVEHDIRHNLEPMLLSGAGLDVDSLFARVGSTLEPLLRLTPSQVEFCENLQRGLLHGALLFPDDPNTAARVDGCAALRWKALNAKQHHDLRRGGP